MLCMTVHNGASFCDFNEMVAGWLPLSPPNLQAEGKTHEKPKVHGPQENVV